jgi:hypothetical protein
MGHDVVISTAYLSLLYTIIEPETPDNLLQGPILNYSLVHANASDPPMRPQFPDPNAFRHFSSNPPQTAP